MTHAIAVLVGSLRRGSYTRKVANTLIDLAPPSLSCEIVEIGNLRLYNADLETDAPPPEWVAFRERIRQSSGVLFATPEYNRSVPGALKNAIDVGSRPTATNAFARKPAAIVSTSIGMISGFGANHHLRQMLVFLDMPAMQQPEAYLAHSDKLFDDDGTLVVASTREFLRKFMDAFAEWVERMVEVPVR
jgi:chromate reductase